MISIVVATSGRPEMFWMMLKSLRDTTQGYDMEIVAVIDDDPKAYHAAVDFMVDVIDYSPIRRGALNAWNRGLFRSDGEIIVPAGDDQVFHVRWLEYALESHKERLGGYGVVGMNDLAYNGNTQVATMFLMDRKFIKEKLGGVLCPPVYRYFCVDMEINEVAKKHGVFYWDERAVIEHLHSAHGKRPVDTLDLEKQDWMEEDNKIFEKRKAQGFPISWSPII